MIMHRQQELSSIAYGLSKVDRSIMDMFWEHHDASTAMFAEIQKMCREGAFDGVKEMEVYLAEAKKNLPPEVCLKCESVLDIPHDNHVCPKLEDEIITAFKRVGEYTGEPEHIEF
jgi:hypothetical protein